MKRKKFQWGKLQGGLRPHSGFGGRPLNFQVQKRTADFYTSRPWRKLMTQIKKARGSQCEVCGTTEGPIAGDHIKEMQDGGAPLDPANVQLLCTPCHNTKTAKAREDRAHTRWLDRSRHLLDV